MLSRAHHTGAFYDGLEKRRVIESLLRKLRDPPNLYLVPTPD